MKDYTPSQLRNVVVLGHQGSGKTTLVESLLKVSGAIIQKGTIENGNTVSDYTKEEKNSKISIYNSLIPVEWEEIKYNFIDTPGFFDFQQEIICASRVARTALIIIDAQKGVEVGTRKHWKYIRSKSIPSIIFINKMDKENIDFDKLIDSVRSQLGKRAVPFCWPIGHGEKFEGFVNVVDMKARIYDGKESHDAEIWPERLDQVKKLHDMIVESVANVDDDVMMKVLEDQEVTYDEIKKGLRKGILSGNLVPVIVGSALKDVGVRTLLRSIRDYFPSEADLRTPFGEATDELEIIERKVDVNEPFSGFVFKTVVDPFIGKISYVAVRSGVMSKDQTILNVNKDEKEKINNISFIRGKEQLETSKVLAGDIGVLIKVNSLETGDTICDPAKPIKYMEIERVQPTIYYALSVKNKNDEGKITESLRKICYEDISITAERNAETKQLLVGCQGQSQIDNVMYKLKNIYNIEAELSDAKISYRETIKGSSDVEGRYVKQSGGSGQYGIVNIKFEPSKETFEFVDDIFGGAVPTNFIPAVQKGLEDAMKTGVLAGFPVIGLKAILHDGKYHPVDSSELAFKMAASFAFKDGCRAANPTILEPIMEIVVVAPNDYVGDIMGDLSKRRGLIMGIEPIGDEQYITAECPQVELQKYIIDLKTMTQGQATFTMKFLRYDEVPSNLVDKIIKENKAEQ
ncbi:MAG: elongation factor G [Erysipelotrichales bacterium]|nr:elongation factor G [Erysipelotrichales bacterium]